MINKENLPEERIVIDIYNHYCNDIDGLFDKLRTEDGNITVMTSTYPRIRTGRLHGISREDGSGFSFIVSVYLDDEIIEIYVNDKDGRRKAKTQDE